MVVDNHRTVQFEVPDIGYVGAGALRAGVITFACARKRTGTFQATIDGEACRVNIQPVADFKSSTMPFLQATVIE